MSILHISVLHPHHLKHFCASREDETMCLSVGLPYVWPVWDLKQFPFETSQSAGRMNLCVSHVFVCMCACVIQMICMYIRVKYLLSEQFVDKWVAMVCIMGSLLSRERFAALLSFEITFSSHKFACIAMPGSLLSLSSIDNFFSRRSKRHPLALRDRYVFQLKLY